jgi:CRP-like cAMP-binding protein
MVDKRELRRMHLLKDMPDAMLDKIAQAGQLRIFSADTVLFQQGDNLEYFYMILTGQVILEVEATPNVSLALGTVRPGYSFGISTFIPGATSSSTAVCIEPCELISLSGRTMTELFQQDWDLGYNFMLRLVRVFKSVMDHRTMLFLKTLQNHPDLLNIFRDLGHWAPAF